MGSLMIREDPENIFLDYVNDEIAKKLLSDSYPEYEELHTDIIRNIYFSIISEIKRIPFIDDIINLAHDIVFPVISKFAEEHFYKFCKTEKMNDDFCELEEHINTWYCDYSSEISTEYILYLVSKIKCSCRVKQNMFGINCAADSFLYFSDAQIVILPILQYQCVKSLFGDEIDDGILLNLNICSGGFLNGKISASSIPNGIEP